MIFLTFFNLNLNFAIKIVNKRVQNAVFGCNLRKDRMISVRFQGKPFNITMVFQGKPFKPFNINIQDLLELTTQKDVLFIIGDWNPKVGSQETPGITGKFGLGIQN